jgi:hypothetical protein
VRPETPPEEREMFVKKQEEIKRMLAAKNTEGARQLAVPTIEPIQFEIERPPKSPSPPLDMGSSSLSTVPKNVIEGAKALDMDYNRKPLLVGTHSKSVNEGEQQQIAMPAANEMSEEELAKMMEEEDFAQHQLKLAGEAIAARSNKLLELEGKEEAFAQFGSSKIGSVNITANQTSTSTTGGNIIKSKEEKSGESTKKRVRKSKAVNTPEKSNVVELQHPTKTISAPEISSPPHIPQSAHRTMPPIHTVPPMSIRSETPPKPSIIQSAIPSIPPLISNAHQPYASGAGLPPRFSGPNQQQIPPPHIIQDRPSVLSSYITSRHETMPPRNDIRQMHPSQIRFPPSAHHLSHPTESFLNKSPMPPHMQLPHPHSLSQHQQHQQQQQSSQITTAVPLQPMEEVEDKKKGRRKKFTPLRTDLPESKVAKLDNPSSVIQSTGDRLSSEEKLSKGN